RIGISRISFMILKLRDLFARWVRRRRANFLTRGPERVWGKSRVSFQPMLRPTRKREWRVPRAECHARNESIRSAGQHRRALAFSVLPRCQPFAVHPHWPAIVAVAKYRAK